MDNNNLILNRFFSKKTLLDVINGRKNFVFTNIASTCARDHTGTNIDVITNVYSFMSKEHRNEYFYKNTLLNKLLLGRHSLRTTTALSEVRVNKSKADFILINGRAVVYEIKTELDTLDRLESQIEDYYKAFSNVCVVTSESNYYKVFKMLKDTPVGIYVLTSKSTISHRKEPLENNSSLNHDIMFKLLRKQEFEEILINCYGTLPQCTPAQYYRKSRLLFQALDIQVAYSQLLRALKKRVRIEEEGYRNLVPYELKYLIYFSQFRMDDYSKLNSFLTRRFGG